jgi:hypothetical protein
MNAALAQTKAHLSRRSVRLSWTRDGWLKIGPRFPRLTRPAVSQYRCAPTDATRFTSFVVRSNRPGGGGGIRWLK